MKKYTIAGAICFIAIILGLVLAYINMPDTVVLYKDRQWQTDTVSKIVSKDDSIETAKGVLVPHKEGSYEASYSILGIPYKDVTLKVIEDEWVIPGGEALGIRLYSDGLVVVAVGHVSKAKVSPAEEAGIIQGDVITHINMKKITDTDSFIAIVQQSDEVLLTVKRGEEEKNMRVKPVADDNGVKKIGVWIRDSTAGVGTLTYILPQSGEYGALGHGISDMDTSVRFEVLKGSVEKCAIAEIIKGEKGAPGELRGEFYESTIPIGDIRLNTEVGIFGTISNVPEKEKVPLGHKSDVKKGDAVLRTSLDGKKVCEYSVKIVKVSPMGKNSSKGFVIEVTDPELIEKTGGIVQGMSGSPIIQDGKLIGAVTHVLVNEPTKGYGIFIEDMIVANCD